MHVFTVIIYFADAANNLTSPTLVQYSEFYNPTLDHLDLMAEYYTWQNPSSCAGYLTTSVDPHPSPAPSPSPHSTAQPAPTKIVWSSMSYLSIFASLS